MAPTGALSKLSVPEATLREWAQCLMNPETTLVARSRALWGLRHANEKLVVPLIAEFLCNVVAPSPIADTLLQHEAAYCLGQRGDPEAVPYLTNVLRDSRHHPVVRHEAAEALAALCGIPGVDMDQVERDLEEFSKGDVVELAETCQVGLGRIKWLRSGGSIDDSDIGKQYFPFTIDPAPASKSSTPATGQQLRDCLLDPKETLFVRYQALFELRDRILYAKMHQDAAEVKDLAGFLAQGLQAPGSALLRHEVAFVLGQLALSTTVPELVACTRTKEEHAMVRHEAAEALGAVLGQIEAEGSNSDSEAKGSFIQLARTALEDGLKDPEPLVRESCVLALDIADYVSSNDHFQYAMVPT